MKIKYFYNTYINTYVLRSVDYITKRQKGGGTFWQR